MSVPRLIVGVVLLPLIVLAAARVWGEDSGDKVLLTDGPLAAGDVFVYDVRDTYDLTYEGVDPKDPTTRLSSVVTNAGRRKTKFTMLAGRRPGVLDRRQTYLIDQVEEPGPKGEGMVTRSTPLQGKTVTVVHQGKALAVNVSGGELPAAELARLRQSTTSSNSLGSILPTRLVSTGEEWSVDPRGFPPVFGSLKLQSLHARLEDNEPFEGHPCARISLTLTAVGRSAAGSLRYELSGELEHALDIQHDLQLTLSGAVAASSRSKTPRGVYVPVEGHGSYEFNASAKWLLRSRKQLPGAQPKSAAQLILPVYGS